MGAEQSAEGKGGLASEILKLKAAKSGGWLSEEEFDTEVKRLIREHNGEAREPAYAFDSVMDIMDDEVQMAEWEARYGDGAGTAAPALAAHRPPPVHVLAPACAAGLVELDLTGGEAASPEVNALLQEIEAQAVAIADLEGQQAAAAGGAAGGDVDGSSANIHVRALNKGEGEAEEDAATASGGAPVTPKALQVPSSDDMGDF